MRRNCCSRPLLQPPFTALNWSSPRSRRSSSRPCEATPMRNIFLIAKREYMEQIRGRAFKATTIGLPAVFAVIGGVAYLPGLGIGATDHLAIASGDAALAA